MPKMNNHQFFKSLKEARELGFSRMEHIELTGLTVGEYYAALGRLKKSTYAVPQVGRKRSRRASPAPSRPAAAAPAAPLTTVEYVSWQA